MVRTGVSVTRRGKVVIFLVVAVVASLVGTALWKRYWVDRAPTFGFQERVAWTLSQVHGSPDPADPYVVQRVFPALTFSSPLDIGFVPGSDRVVVVQRAGEIYTFPNKPAVRERSLLIDVGKLPSLEQLKDHTGVECSSITFDPEFAKNRACYICYHANFKEYKSAVDYARLYPQNAVAERVSRFTLSDTLPPTIDPSSEQILLAWPGNGHFAGCLKFGPDGYLYISTGDNGDPNPPDPFNVGQNLGDLRAKILRIDVHHPAADKPYSIPADNPFVNTPGARGEVFAYGLRNPWRFSFDRQSGHLWAGDVGWELWESIQRVVSGGNYGWSIMEGPQPVHPDGKRGPTPIIPPALALPHTESASLTGGFVYHGKRLPELQNQYVFGDWETRRIWAAPIEGKKLGAHRTIAQTDLRVVSFGEDADGELYIVDFEGGGIWRLAPNPSSGSEHAFPRKLSETGLFANVSEQRPNPGVVPFNINAPQWVDGSTSVRFIAVPTVDRITESDGKLNFPKDTVLVRTFSLPMTVDDSTRHRNIETQLLHYDGRQWHGYSYQWDAGQTDATLVDGNGGEAALTVVDPAAPDGKRRQTWQFNSRAQCMTCHTAWTHYALAFTPPQLDRTEKYQVGSFGLTADNQLRSLRHIGLLPAAAQQAGPADAPGAEKRENNLVNPYAEDEGRSLEDRARSYLAVNCSICHRFGGGGTALIDLSREKSLKEMKVLMAPMLGAFNLPNAQVVFPGDASRSVLYYRMAKSGAGHMPHLGATLADDQGLALIARWIQSLPADASTPPATEQERLEAAGQSASLLTLSQASVADRAVAATDQLLSTTQGAMKLLMAVEDGRVQPGYRAMIGRRAAASPQETVRDLFVRFGPEQGSAGARVGTNPDPAKLLALSGDAERGRKIFFEAGGGICAKCHMVGDKGTDFGPNLTQIGAKYSRAEMLDNILHPSKTIAPGYEVYLVRTKNQDVYVGFLVSKSDMEVVLKDQNRKVVRVNGADIDKMVMQPISAMPEGVIADLTPQEVADLLEFLAMRK